MLPKGGMVIAHSNSLSPNVAERGGLMVIVHSNSLSPNVAERGDGDRTQ